MSFDDYIAFAEEQAGQRIPTAGRRSHFRVVVQDTRLEFILDSGKIRQESFPYVENFCNLYEERGSTRPVDYPETRNASYLIGLARAFEAEEA